jgi:putative transposase
MKANTTLMHPELYYHVYNRGINGEQLFKQERNYAYFLQQYAKYIEPIATTYAYVLMGNHFHFFISIKTEAEIRQNLPPKSNKTVEHLISNQFAKLFNSYAQSIDKQEQRTGGLFERPFRRILVSDEGYAAQMVYYIHFNPQKHKFINDFRLYPHSSYRAFVEEHSTRIPRDLVFSWFGGRKAFFDYHGACYDFDEDWLDKQWIEVD